MSVAALYRNFANNKNILRSNHKKEAKANVSFPKNTRQISSAADSKGK